MARSLSKLDLLKEAGESVLNHLSALSAQEAQLARMYPVSAERFQYAIDKITQAMSDEIEQLSASLRRD